VLPKHRRSSPRRVWLRDRIENESEATNCHRITFFGMNNAASSRNGGAVKFASLRRSVRLPLPGFSLRSSQVELSLNIKTGVAGTFRELVCLLSNLPPKYFPEPTGKASAGCWQMIWRSSSPRARARTIRGHCIRGRRARTATWPCFRGGLGLVKPSERYGDGSCLRGCLPRRHWF
jgi:hypothetical protein